MQLCAHAIESSVKKHKRTGGQINWVQKQRLDAVHAIRNDDAVVRGVGNKHRVHCMGSDPVDGAIVPNDDICDGPRKEPIVNGKHGNPARAPAHVRVRANDAKHHAETDVVGDSIATVIVPQSRAVCFIRRRQTRDTGVFVCNELCTHRVTIDASQGVQYHGHKQKAVPERLRTRGLIVVQCKHRLERIVRGLEVDLFGQLLLEKHIPRPLHHIVVGAQTNHSQSAQNGRIEFCVPFGHKLQFRQRCQVLVPLLVGNGNAIVCRVDNVNVFNRFGIAQHCRNGRTRRFAIQSDVNDDGDLLPHDEFFFSPKSKKQMDAEGAAIYEGGFDAMEVEDEGGAPVVVRAPAKDKEEAEEPAPDPVPDVVSLADIFALIMNAAKDVVPIMCVSSDGTLLVRATMAEGETSPLFFNLVVHYFDAIRCEGGNMAQIDRVRLKHWLYETHHKEMYMPREISGSDEPCIEELEVSRLVNVLNAEAADIGQSFLIVYQDFENMLRSFCRNSKRGYCPAFHLMHAICRHITAPTVESVEKVLQNQVTAGAVEESDCSETISVYNIVMHDMVMEIKGSAL